MVALYQHGVVALGNHGAVPNSFHKILLRVSCAFIAPQAAQLERLSGVIGLAYPVATF
jgi:hypothetical protein